MLPNRCQHNNLGKFSTDWVVASHTAKAPLGCQLHCFITPPVVAVGNPDRCALIRRWIHSRCLTLSLVAVVVVVEVVSSRAMFTLNSDSRVVVEVVSKVSDAAFIAPCYYQHVYYTNKHDVPEGCGLYRHMACSWSAADGNNQQPILRRLIAATSKPLSLAEWIAWHRQPACNCRSWLYGQASPLVTGLSHILGVLLCVNAVQAVVSLVEVAVSQGVVVSQGALVVVIMVATLVVVGVVSGKVVVVVTCMMMMTISMN